MSSEADVLISRSSLRWTTADATSTSKKYSQHAHSPIPDAPYFRGEKKARSDLPISNRSRIGSCDVLLTPSRVAQCDSIRRSPPFLSGGVVRGGNEIISELNRSSPCVSAHPVDAGKKKTPRPLRVKKLGAGNGKPTSVDSLTTIGVVRVGGQVKNRGSRSTRCQGDGYWDLNRYINFVRTPSR